MRRPFQILVLLVIASPIFAQTQPTLPSQLWGYLARYERREWQWMMEAMRKPRYLNKHHKSAIKAFERGDWATAVSEYEACVRTFGLSFRQTTSDSDLEDVQRAQLAVLNSPSLNTIRYELALSYSSRAAEYMGMGWSSEADSLIQLSIFFLEHVRVYAASPASAGLAFIRIGNLNRSLGRDEEAVRNFRGALWVTESDLPISDPLRATANLRLGETYLALGKYYEAEPPLLNGTESADSASATHPKIHDWCYGLAVEGRLLLAEDCRLLGRESEAESLYSEALAMAMAPEQPGIHPRQLAVLENYSQMLRASGRGLDADTVNYRTDVLRRRWEKLAGARSGDKKR